MVMLHGNQRFFVSTRGRIVTLLRRESRTVDELAQILDLTDNAVRAHLATLERDGFIRQQGARRGSSKPSFVYELAPEAEQLFPKAYSQVLDQLLDALSMQMTPEELDTVMRRVGSSIAAQRSIPSGDLRARLELAADVLNELGGLADLEEQDGTYSIRGYSCPLSAVVPGHPRVCHLAETLLAEMAGVPIQEHCDRSGSPRCSFVVANS